MNRKQEIGMKKLDILGTHIDSVSLEESIQLIKNTVTADEELWIITANPELIFKAEKEDRLRAMINSADLVIPDGIGVVWAAGKLGNKLKERVTGVDLTSRILEEGNLQKWRVFLLGARPGVAEKAAAEQSKKHTEIIFDWHHGYFTEKEEHGVIEKIRKFAPDVLLVGLGAPRQDYWNSKNRELAKVRIGVGGTIDVLAGEAKRAPRFFQKTGLEWLFRLVTDPSRIRRQVILPLYVLKVLRQIRR